jgi:hypothetical protein
VDNYFYQVERGTIGTMKTKEMATERARLYPSTYNKIRIQAARQGKTIAQVIDEIYKYSKKAILPF